VILFLKNLLFTIIVPGTVAGFIPYTFTKDHPPASTTWLILSTIFFVIGVSIYLWCLWDFATFGRGTPAPFDAPKKLVIRGLYHYIRNPMYVGVLSTLLGWVVRYQMPKLFLYVLFVWCFFHMAVVLFEEPRLQKLFGSDYEQYRSRVGRWLPKIGKKPGR